MAASKKDTFSKLEVTYRPIESLIPYARNSRTHSDAQVAQIAASIKEFGWTNPVLIDSEGLIIAGHGRIMAGRKLGMIEAPCIVLANLTDAQRRAYVIADNKLALNAGWDVELLKVELKDLDTEKFDLTLTGFEIGELATLFDDAPQEIEIKEEQPKGNLADRFGVPPFSVLNAREGWWQDRKRAWLSIGIQSELGRGENGFHAVPGGSPMVSGYDKDGKRLVGIKNISNNHDNEKNGTKAGLTFGSFNEDINAPDSGTSIFDPVLCELSYRWFCPQGGMILDPFAGGSVRGIVASKLGRQYFGCELRPEQIEANREQANSICSDSPPVWHCGDSREIVKHAAGIEADFLFSCPPYADLEVYSDNPQDLSTLAYNDFREAYFNIIAESAKLLKDDRFACFVIGEVRGKNGNYYGFVPDTIEAFRRAGLAFYNEAILVTAVGSMRIRVGKQFEVSRKIGKTHQNVLVFVKGDAKRATKAIGSVEFGEIEENINSDDELVIVDG